MEAALSSAGVDGRARRKWVTGIPYDPLMLPEVMRAGLQLLTIKAQADSDFELAFA